ncbi:hypothetical protein CONLIGDRAFT_684951 [Coniochaeta ligniaria NRRL 30616]|uniref:Uncharacterized protein n=1 Tax=Coniochaeta ligniaria NRRL 30616 TaxID=1408157 RepID=A0A1J7IBL8_9PEZI|nr:hypothetical protein CONLIGDRAFT_684951 [Coniochaeta ligniaria NRRL 30616]
MILDLVGGVCDDEGPGDEGLDDHGLNDDSFDVEDISDDEDTDGGLERPELMLKWTYSEKRLAPAAAAKLPGHVAGNRRAVPCLGCAKSASKGSSRGDCLEVVNRKVHRCIRCTKEVACRPVPVLARTAAVELVELSPLVVTPSPW